jgi:hypothetical protein
MELIVLFGVYILQRCERIAHSEMKFSQLTQRDKQALKETDARHVEFIFISPISQGIVLLVFLTHSNQKVRM